MAHRVLLLGDMRGISTTLLVCAASLAFAACASGVEGVNVGDSSGNENELAVNEIVQEGDVLRVTATILNLRASGSTSAAILGKLSYGQILTVASTSGGTGWVNVETGDGKVGWVFGRYVVLDDDTTYGDGGSSGGSGGSCDPSGAGDVVTSYQKVLHDAIAYAEGTRGYSEDGYDVMFSFRISPTGCVRHPNVCVSYGSTCSTAAGRYQYLKGTWDSVASARNFTSFSPRNQEKGAAYLISTVRRVTVPQTRAMTASEFSNAMSKLSYEWASLPPGRYGQPNKSSSQMRSFYCSLVSC